MGTNKHANGAIASAFFVFQNGDAEPVERLWTSVHAVDGLLTNSEVMRGIEVSVGFSVLRHFTMALDSKLFGVLFLVVGCFCILVCWLSVVL
jgi:hypothetical protein